MNAHFIYSMALILFAFFLCFWYRNETTDRSE